MVHLSVWGFELLSGGFYLILALTLSISLSLSLCLGVDGSLSIVKVRAVGKWSLSVKRKEPLRFRSGLCVALGMCLKGADGPQGTVPAVWS